MGDIDEYANIRTHHRVNDIFFGALERPALQWLSTRMPAWITPDMLTGVGLLGAVIILVSYTLCGFNRNFLWLASFGYAVNWFGDSLDGTLARYRHIERPRLGFFIDHVTDAICQVMIFLGLGFTPYVHFNIACLALIAYLLLSVLVYIRTYVVGEYQISYGKLGPTEVRVIAISLNTFMYFGGLLNPGLILKVPGWFGSAFANPVRQITLTPYDLVVTVVGCLLFYFFGVTAIQQLRALSKLGE